MIFAYLMSVAVVAAVFTSQYKHLTGHEAGAIRTALCSFTWPALVLVMVAEKMAEEMAKARRKP